MTSSAGNITTQWTFRDGRDYVLSLTTTKTPSTVSFWISDKITGEEWTGCYDEKCIEVLTKRTGCFKGFSTFLSMVKSAMLKKSDSVILELLNIQDLAAISVHQQGSFNNDCGKRSPINFDFYSNVTVTSAKGKPHTVPSTDTNININGVKDNGSNSNNNKAQPQPPPSPLNKRKYLIVSYIGEFDKVHYPLPLNYTNSPDLNVMQSTIVNLKAEVTSLKNSKKELEERLESIKVSGLMPQHSHENNNDANISFPPSPFASNASDLRTCKEPVFGSQNLCKGADSADINGNTEMNASQTCIQCSVKVQALLAKNRDLENTISSQREQYFENLEKLENENHFLRHKVETSERYELELWNRIQLLEAKVEKENLAKERKAAALKDTRKNQSRLSRHDLFYRATYTGDTKPIRKVSSKSPANLYQYNKVLCHEPGANGTKKCTQLYQRSRSHSNCASYSSVDRNGTQRNGNCRSSSSSSYHGINFSSGMPKSRSGSMSPAKRFDPTAYVTEKKMKRSKVANLRMQKIESRIRVASAGSMRGRSISPSPPSPAHLTRTTISPTTLLKLRNSLSGENFTKNYARKMDDGDMIKPTKEYAVSFQHRVQKKIIGDLNVMQSTIVNLKAEVTSLKNSKKELEERLESIKVSGLMPQHSHENNNDANISFPPSPFASNASDLRTCKEPVFGSQNLCKGADSADINGNTEMNASQTCIQCSVKVQALLAKNRDLENTISSQREQYFENLEKLENENHFLRHKVETSEKYELELWNRIQLLEAKVEKENLAKERKAAALKDTRKNQSRLSRHDLFYRATYTGDTKPIRKVSSKSPANLYQYNKVLCHEPGANGTKKCTQLYQRSRSHSNCASYSSVDRNGTQRNGNCRSSSSSSYHGINFSSGMPKSRSGSMSPAKRFDPTAYVTEKKMKQSKVANLRMQKIESRIRVASAGSMRGRSISPSPPSPAHLTRTTISPTTLLKLRNSLSGENFTKNYARKMDDGDMIKPTKEYAVSFQHRVQKKIIGGNSRSPSAENYRTKVVSPVTRFSSGGTWPENLVNAKLQVARKTHQDKFLTKSCKEKSPVAPTFTSELKDRLIRSPAKLTGVNKPYKNKTNSIAVNTSFTCDKLDPLVTLEDRKSSKKRKSEKKDISFLQEKLSALNAFLETCKPKD